VQKPPLDPDVADVAPTDLILTPYDHEHAVTCLRMLDADAEGADWQEVAREMDDRARLSTPLARWLISFAKLISGLLASATLASPHG
jgi:hypothetical protein